jgi:shikimate kinase
MGLITMLPLHTDEKSAADRWLAGELNRIWLISERALRAFQHARLRPPHGHPEVLEIETLLAARRIARLGPDAPPPDDTQLASAIEEVERELVELRRAAPIQRLIENLHLHRLEVETLVTVLAPHIDAPLTDLFGVLRGSTTGRRGVDLALVSQLFRLHRRDRVALLDIVDPDRPLLHWRLVHVASAESPEGFGSVAYRALRPSFDLLSALCGRTQLAPDLKRTTQIAWPEPALDELVLDEPARARVAQACDSAFAARAHSERPPWLVIWGVRGAGKRTIAGQIAAHGGRPLVAFDPSNLDRSALDDVVPRVQREALIRGAMLYVGPLSPELLDGSARELVRRFAAFPAPLIVGVDASEPPRIASPIPLQELALPLPSEPLRAKLWSRVLPPAHRGPDLQVDALARAFHLSPGEIDKAGREALAVARSTGTKVPHSEVRGGIERRLRSDLGDVARRIVPSTKWSDLVLASEDLDRIQEFISRRKYYDLVYERWGYGERVGYGIGLIGLFSGPPGTGKTMLAGLIAKALDLDLYQIDLGQVVSKWVGETEKQLGNAFDQAERAHAVLLFDEADSLFSRRTDVRSSNDRYANMAVNYLLQRIERYTGVAVMTTNKDAQLDEALQRRLTLHVRLKIPGPAERARLWRTFLPEGAPVQGTIDFAVLAREFELSGGYIKNAAVRAAFLAASHAAPIDMEVLRLASALELEDMGRVALQRTVEASHIAHRA